MQTWHNARRPFGSRCERLRVFRRQGVGSSVCLLVPSVNKVVVEELHEALLMRRLDYDVPDETIDRYRCKRRC
jgi:hypothetical protein